MESYLASIDYWHWWILAGILLIIEVAAPSFFFLWLSIAAGITGLVLLAAPELGWQLVTTSNYEDELKGTIIFQTLNSQIFL